MTQTLIDAGSGPTHPTPTHPPNPRPTGPERPTTDPGKATGPDGPINPKPDPGPTTPRAYIPDPGTPPPPPKPGPTPPPPPRYVHQGTQRQCARCTKTTWHHKGRGLCSACYQHLYTRGELEQYPTVRRRVAA